MRHVITAPWTRENMFKEFPVAATVSLCGVLPSWNIGLSFWILYITHHIPSHLESVAVSLVGTSDKSISNSQKKYPSYPIFCTSRSLVDLSHVRHMKPPRETPGIWRLSSLTARRRSRRRSMWGTLSGSVGDIETWVTVDRVLESQWNSWWNSGACHLMSPALPLFVSNNKEYWNRCVCPEIRLASPSKIINLDDHLGFPIAKKQTICAFRVKSWMFFSYLGGWSSSDE